MKDIGTNLCSVSKSDLENKELIDEYLKDIAKLKERQKEVFTYFRVNESALKQKN